MELAVKTCTLDLPFEEMLDLCAAQGVTALEIATGNWSAAPHCDLEGLLASEDARARWLDAIRARGLELCALNCSGNPLAFERDMAVTEQTFRLAELLGVKKIVMMSGLPAGCRGDRTPVWITASWPPETQDILRYQWEEIAIPEWKRLAALAHSCGIERIALENHGMQLVYNPETCILLREAVGDDILGMNLDPSHLFWMGGDPVAAARYLGERKALYHVHGKDVRMETPADVNGVLDTKTIEHFAERSWNYVAVGAGHDVRWWRKFLSVCRENGYDGPVSLEMEDLGMGMLEGHLFSLKTLREALGTGKSAC